MGATAYNSIPNKKNGTLTGSTLPEWRNESECISGKCLYFNGVDNAVSIGLGNNYFPLNKFSICTWIKTPGLAPGMTTPGIFSFTYGLRISLTNSGEFITSIDNGVNGPSLTAPGNLFDNKFHYLCLTYDGTNRNMYVDGVKKKSAATTWLGTTRWPTNGVNIGRDNNNSMYFFKGYIDEPKIYSYARTADQIKLDYNSRGSSKGSSVNIGIKSSTAPDLNSKLVAYYKFDEGSSTIVNNSVNGGVGLSGIFGTGNSAPTWTNNGKINKGLNFGGINYLTITDSNNSLDFGSGGFTISFFTFKTANGYQGGSYIRKGSYTSGFDSYDNMFRVNTVNGELAHINLNATLNKWEHHLFVVTQNSTPYINHYIDGKLNNVGYFGVGNTGVYGSDSFSDLIIGYSNAGGGQRFFNGLIDEVKIYNTSLTADEVKQDYNQGSSIQFGATNQTIGGTITDLNYCIPGDTSACASPVAEWNFEENTGTVAKDTSGNNLNGTFGAGNSAPTWTQGKIGSGLNFDGINDYGETIQSTTLPNDISISMWIYPTSWTHQTHTALISSRTVTNGLMFFILSQGNLNFDWGSVADRWNTGYQPPLNQWTYLTITRNSNFRTLYVNGKYQNSTAVVGTPSTNSTNIRIGNDNSAGTYQYFFKGKIDGVKIYNYARTPAQVAYDYNKGAPIAWWKLDECQGLTAFDASGLGNTGTIVIGGSGSQTSAGTCQVGTSAAWTNGASGKINSSLNFDGTDDYMTAPIPVNGYEATIAFWVKNPAYGLGSYLLRSNANSRTYVNISGSSISFTKGDPAVNLGSYPITTSNWNHILLKWWTTSGTTYGQAYINGNPIGIGKTFSYNSQGSYITVAGFSNTGTQNAAGQFDDVRVYNYALTSEQIKVLYNGGAINFK